ncbi:MAG: serine hydrolase [Desulfobacula sp.]|jgi:beta-lactamase class A|nr:serine hydrolase [Desulfobacula sp.]
MKTIAQFVILILLLIVPGIQASPSPDLLDTICDTKLQKGLEQALEQLNLSKAAAGKNLTIALVDITNPFEPRHAYINPNEMMYAASLPKIAILLGAFDRISNNEMTLDRSTEQTLTRMIRNSSNHSATTMLNRVGKDYLADLLQSPRYKLYDPLRNGGLWVGKEYARAGAWKRDPVNNLSHGATALQVARFYFMLETGQLVTPEYSRLMKSILGEPAINHKFVKGIQSVYPESNIFRKSGTWKSFHSDSAIIERNNRSYIAVAMANNPMGGQWLSDLIVSMDKLIFENAPSRK